MIYFTDAELDHFLMEDIYRGDLTTRALGIEDVPSKISFRRKHSGRVAGVEVAVKLLHKLQLEVNCFVKDGEDVEGGAVLIEATGPAANTQQAWKVVQVLLEWCCGVAQYTAEFVNAAREVNPKAAIACTRKAVPGSRKLATLSVLAGGGYIHRAGASETILVFANHRALLDEQESMANYVEKMRCVAPETKILIEADTLAEVQELISAKPDVIQLDKFSLNDVVKAKALVDESQLPITLSVAGGVNKNNVAQYAETGVNLFITSAPYYSGPDDIKVHITPLV